MKNRQISSKHAYLEKRQRLVSKQPTKRLGEVSVSINKEAMDASLYSGKITLTAKQGVNRKVSNNSFLRAHILKGIASQISSRPESIRVGIGERVVFNAGHLIKLSQACGKRFMSEETKQKTFYDFKATKIDGSEVEMSSYKGYVCLVVNVASKCGLTKQNYNELNMLSIRKEGKPFKVLAFPCNQFLYQESGTNEEIQCFVKDKMRCDFDLFQKIDVNGKNAHPLYEFLKQEAPGTLGNSIKWNFTKFLIDSNGGSIKRYGPQTNPLSFEKDIDEYLAKAQ